MVVPTPSQEVIFLGQMDRQFTLAEAAEQCGVRPRTLERWIRLGKFPPPVKVEEEHLITCRRKVQVPRVREVDLAAWLEAHRPAKAARPSDRLAA